MGEALCRRKRGRDQDLFIRTVSYGLPLGMSILRIGPFCAMVRLCVSESAVSVDCVEEGEWEVNRGDAEARRDIQRD